MKDDPIARLLTDSPHGSIKPEWPAFPAFVEVSRTFVESYSKLAQAGFPPDSIARAMMGATVNFYEMFGLSDDLPTLLRAIAERMERTPS